MQLLPGIGRGRACKCIYQRMRCMRESKRRSGKKILLSTILKPSERLNTHTESHQQIIIITLPINSTTTLLSQWHSLSFKLPRFAAVVCFGLIELSNMLYYASNMCAHNMGPISTFVCVVLRIYAVQGPPVNVLCVVRTSVIRFATQLHAFACLPCNGQRQQEQCLSTFVLVGSTTITPQHTICVYFSFVPVLTEKLWSLCGWPCPRGNPKHSKTAEEKNRNIAYVNIKLCCAACDSRFFESSMLLLLALCNRESIRYAVPFDSLRSSDMSLCGVCVGVWGRGQRWIYINRI